MGGCIVERPKMLIFTKNTKKKNQNKQKKKKKKKNQNGKEMIGAGCRKKMERWEEQIYTLLLSDLFPKNI